MESNTKAKPSCWNCKFASIDSGDSSVGIGAYVDSCNNPKVDQNLLDDENYSKDKLPVESCEEYAARKCNNFVPELFEKCYICSKEVNKPLYLWSIWTSDFWGDNYPVCSIECQNRGEEKYKEDKESYELDITNLFIV